MESCVTTKLQQLGYNINTIPYEKIDVCNMWYQNQCIDDFHKRTTLSGVQYEIDRMNFAKRGCADDANLCEVIEVNVGDDTMSDAVKTLLEKNRFDTMYRDQLERMSATGTVGAYIYLDNAMYLSDGTVTGGDIRICYCYAENYVPLRIINKEIIEAAFAGVDYVNGEKRTTLVTFTQENNAGKMLYKADTYVFDKDAKELMHTWLQLGDIKPFEIMRVAEVNNIEKMEGFGLPKILNAIPTLKKLDLCNMILNGDLDKGEKLLLTNETMLAIDKETGQPKEQTGLMKKLFVFLGEKMPETDSIIKEYNPEIRIDSITKAMEFCLSLFSMMFGFGTKQYKFESGQIQTATQYIGERQDKMQELNRQRKQSDLYIKHIVRALLWFSNQFNGTTYDLNAEIVTNYDDSYIEDKNTKIEAMRADAVSFSDIQEFTIRYIMERLSVDEEQAMAIYENRTIEETPTV